jgi:CheY-like chemotaxis protein
MIVDDDPGDLDLIKKAFERCGVKDKILCMDDGWDAISYLNGEGEYADREKSPYPSFVITDLKMPKVDGFDILEHFKNHPSRNVVPKIILSSSEDPDDIRTAYMLGASSYHVKPFKYDELCSLIKSLHDYWKTSKSPLVDSFGKQLTTESAGKQGARFSRPDQSC